MNNKPLSRRDFMKSCAAGASVLLGSGLTPKRAFADSNKKPNVVLVVTDDHGLDAVGCYGNTVIKTANLDRLAAEGVRFTHAFCTSASCSASRSVILTGLYNHANGQYGHQHGYHHFISFENIKSVPVLLNQAGYRTARIGKLHVAPQSVYKFDVTLEAHARSPVDMANKCKAFINADKKPFFLYFCTSDPHRSKPYRSDLPYRPNLFGNRPKGYPGVTEVKYDPKDVIVPSFLPDTPECHAELAQYYQSVSRFDQGLGRLVEVLKESGKYDETLIIYISDNGIAFPGAKTTLYEPGMRLPCIVRSPWQKNRGITCDAMVTFADLAPTILDFAGAPAVLLRKIEAAGAEPNETQFHGRSFKSVLEQENPRGWDEIYASHTFHEITMYYPMRVVRRRKYKLIWNIAYGLEYPFATDLYASGTWQSILQSGNKYFAKRSVEAFLHRPEFELYDLEEDRDEIKNLAGDTKYKKVLTELKSKIKAFQQRTRDPWIIKWEHKDVFGGQSLSGL